MEKTTKQQFIELVNRNYPNVEPQVVESCIGKAFNMLFYGAFRKDLSNLDLYAKTFRDVPVLKDETDTYYCMLPCQTVQLPDSSEGVRRIYLKKGIRILKFVPLQESAWDFNLSAYKIAPWVGYSVKPDRVRFRDNPQCESVYMDLVVPFELMDDDDPVYIPSGQDELLLQTVSGFLQGSPPVNKDNK